MLEYSQGFWYRHHPKPSRTSWWELVDTYKWRIMVGVCFVGLLLYWALGGLFSPDEVVMPPLVSEVTPLTIDDPWTHADGEVGAFVPVTQEILNFTPSVGVGAQRNFSPATVVPIAAVEPTLVEESPALFFEEPDFVCEYLNHPAAFHYCVSIGESQFLRQQESYSLSRPLPVGLLLSIFGTDL